MSRAALLCCTALALVLETGAAQGQGCFGGLCNLKSPTDQELLTERLARESKPLTDRIMQDQSLINGPSLQSIFATSPGIKIIHTTPPTVAVLSDGGGRIDTYASHWRTIAASGAVVEVFGPCGSACTMVIAYIPKERLCFGPRAELNFHQTRMKADGSVSLTSTQWMIDDYPADIRDWIMAKGGVERMPSEGRWTLPASELWTMGYRKCND
jgi:hypothetical protein